MAKRTQPSEGCSSQKKAQKGPEVEVPSQETPRPEAGLETIFSANENSEEEGELAPTISLHHRSRCNRGPTLVIVEEVPEMLAKVQAAGDVSVPESETTGIAPPLLSEAQKKYD